MQTQIYLKLFGKKENTHTVTVHTAGRNKDMQTRT